MAQKAVNIIALLLLCLTCFSIPILITFINSNGVRHVCPIVGL